MKVLIADGSPLVQDYYTEKLRGSEVKILSAITIEQARKKLKRHPDIGVIVCGDMFTPHDDKRLADLIGLHNTSFTKANPTQDIPYILISTSSDLAAMRAQASLGCNIYCERRKVMEALSRIVGDRAIK